MIGIVKVQSTDLNISLLEQQATVLGITELLMRAFVDAGLREEVSWPSKQSPPGSPLL